MFEPLPGNYVWNLSVNLALVTGGNHGNDWNAEVFGMPVG